MSSSRPFVPQHFVRREDGRAGLWFIEAGRARWRPVRLGSLELGAPLVAAAAADLDGDGKAELYLVTAREVVAVGVGARLRELGRVAFTGEPAVPQARDVVGAAVVDGDGLVATVSAWAKDLRVSWRRSTLTAKHGPGGFLVCGERLALARGKNHFRDGAAAMLGARCRDDLVDAAGLPLRVRAELSVAGALEVAVARCAPAAAGGAAAPGAPAACQPVASYTVKDVGAAFELADVDRDGSPEAIVSSASAPGDPDTVRVIALGHPGKPLFKRTFHGGVVGLVFADADGDGVAEVLAVVRLAGATRVDVWRLD